MGGIKWYAYITQDNKLQVKRFFSSQDLDDARESNFVSAVFPEMEFDSREEAVAYYKTLM
jgi:hypothetical protein